MDEVIKNIKAKLSTDNLVEMMKDAKVIDDNLVKEEVVRKTLEELDHDNLIHVDELAQKLKEITEGAALQTKAENKVSIVEPARGSMFAVLGQEKEEKKPSNNDEGGFVIKDNITGFID